MSIRGWRSRVRILLLLGVLGVSVGVFVQHGDSWMEAPGELLEHAQELAAAMSGAAAAQPESDHAPFGLASLLAFGILGRGCQHRSSPPGPSGRDLCRECDR